IAVPIGAKAAMNTAEKTVVIEAGVSEGALKT
ncbi:hypothetical protein ACO0DA_11535, partial [Bacillus subtilis]